MTIQEALKSGKPFKREFQSKWFLLGGLTGFVWFVNEKNQYDINTEYGLTRADILAEDWMIKE